MDLLQALAHAELPVEFVQPAMQEELRILQDAGYIICDLPCAGEAGPTRIHLVTSLGRKALRHFGNPGGHFKFPHLWPVKFLQAGRLNYEMLEVSRAMRAAASLSR